MTLVLILWIVFQVMYFRDRANGSLTPFKSAVALLVDVFVLVIVWVSFTDFLSNL